MGFPVALSMVCMMNHCQSHYLAWDPGVEARCHRRGLRMSLGKVRDIPSVSGVVTFIDEGAGYGEN